MSANPDISGLRNVRNGQTALTATSYTLIGTPGSIRSAIVVSNFANSATIYLRYVNGATPPSNSAVATEYIAANDTTPKMGLSESVQVYAKSSAGTPTLDWTEFSY